MELRNMRLQEGIFLDHYAIKVGVKGITGGVGAAFTAHYLDRILNERGKSRVFVSRPDKFIVTSSFFEYDEEDIIVGVMDPLPALLIEGAGVIEELMNCRTPVVWLLNRDNPGVNRRAIKRYLSFMPDFSQDEISREMICRAAYNCVELEDIAKLEGIEKLARYLKAFLSNELTPFLP